MKRQIYCNSWVLSHARQLLTARNPTYWRAVLHVQKTRIEPNQDSTAASSAMAKLFLPVRLTSYMAASAALSNALRVTPCRG